MDLTAHQLASALLFGLAGLCAFLMLMNRVLILRRDSGGKVPVIILSGVGLVGGGCVAGYLLAHSPWVLLPVGFLGLVLIGEVRGWSLRRSCAGSPPVESTPLRGGRAALVTTTDLVVHRYEVPHPKWRGPPLRIVHLTDLHIHPAIPLEYYREAIAVAEQAKPDLAVLTGDYISGAEMLPRLREVLRPIARWETCATLGNHDYWADPGGVRTVLRECGLRLLSDETRVLSVGDQQIAVSGCDHPWGANDRGITPPGQDLLHIVLSHTPDNIYRLAEASADFVFAGHYHAGQIRIPLLGPILIPSVYGRRYDRGHFVVNGTHLFVASGIGSVNLPVRIACRPDILVVDILPGEERQR